mmetsp:Transcript_106881/g.310220  ORF Transcript_106881/g.310220 Transcript_106881/m.310220 type:complete len:202 (-) Transcript_106881:555-1160(-)
MTARLSPKGSRLNRCSRPPPPPRAGPNGRPERHAARSHPRSLPPPTRRTRAQGQKTRDENLVNLMKNNNAKYPNLLSQISEQDDAKSLVGECAVACLCSGGIVLELTTRPCSPTTAPSPITHSTTPQLILRKRCGRSTPTTNGHSSCTRPSSSSSNRREQPIPTCTARSASETSCGSKATHNKELGPIWLRSTLTPKRSVR